MLSAREPRGTPRGKIPNTVAREVRLRSGLARAAQTLGALERAVQLAIDHSIARQQFGRSISKFQAVQMLVAEAAEEAALARAAVEYAIEVTRAAWDPL